MRHSLACVLGVTLCLGAGGFATGSARESSPAPRAAIEVLLTLAPEVPAPSRTALIHETTAIWQADGVTLTWLPGAADLPPARGRLRVLITRRHGCNAPEGQQRLTVGELLRPRTGHPAAVISLDVAECIVRSSGFPESAPLHHRRLGLVLGRAVAHEIGHYILDTHVHARQGLMRPRFDAREFAGLDSGAFMLAPGS